MALDASMIRRTLFVSRSLRHFHGTSESFRSLLIGPRCHLPPCFQMTSRTSPFATPSVWIAALTFTITLTGFAVVSSLQEVVLALRRDRISPVQRPSRLPRPRIKCRRHPPSNRQSRHENRRNCEAVRPRCFFSRASPSLLPSSSGVSLYGSGSVPTMVRYLDLAVPSALLRSFGSSSFFECRHISSAGNEHSPTVA
jgi:hypothetical protein